MRVDNINIIPQNSYTHNSTNVLRRPLEIITVFSVLHNSEFVSGFSNAPS